MVKDTRQHVEGLEEAELPQVECRFAVCLRGLIQVPYTPRQV